jgi:hypothetical protein
VKSLWPERFRSWANVRVNPVPLINRGFNGLYISLCRYAVEPMPGLIFCEPLESICPADSHAAIVAETIHQMAAKIHCLVRLVRSWVEVHGYIIRRASSVCVGLVPDTSNGGCKRNAPAIV